MAMATATMTTEQSAAELQRSRFPLTDRELRQYSLARAILVSADNQEGSERAERNCFELEVSQTIEKSVTGKRYGGLFIPRNIGAGEFARKGPNTQKRAGLDSKTSTAGAELKFTEPGIFYNTCTTRCA
jgi:hypothetical protein